MSSSVAARWAAWERRTGGTVAPAMGGPAPGAVTFGPEGTLRQRVLIALTPDYRLPYWQWGWEDITRFVRWEPGISVTDGRRDESGTVSTLNGSLTLANDGRFSRRNAFGPYFGKLTKNTPIWASVDPGSGWIDQLHGYIPSWPKRWDTTGTDSTAPISIGGVMRWLGQTDDVRVPIYRAVQALSPDAHWSLGDAVDATSAGSALPGGRPATTFKYTAPSLPADSSTDAILFGAEGGPAGTDTSLSLSYGCGITCPLPGGAATAVSVSEWFVPGADPAVATVMSLSLGGSIQQLDLTVDIGLGSVTVSAFYSDGSFAQAPTVIAVEAGVPHHAVITAENSGADARYIVYLDGVQIASTLDTVAQVALPRNIDIANRAASVPATSDYFLLLSQPAFWSRALTASEVAGLYAATDCHDGEMAHERLRRVFGQQPVPFYCVASRSAVCGPQPRGTIMEIARDAEKADAGGVLFEHEFGFGYKAASEFQNQPVTYALDQAQGQLAGWVEADDDDQGYVRQWTATRGTSGRDATDRGSSVTYRDPSYLEGQALPTGGNSYNVAGDDQLGDIASMRVWLGILDEDRWPQLAVNLRQHPEIIPMVAAAPPFGARLTVANPFEEVGVDSIDVIIQGSARRWNSLQWAIAWNTTPASPYNIGVYDDRVSRYGANATYLAEDLDETETLVDVTAGETWATTASHPTAFPGDVLIGGVRYSCTGITGTAPNYQLTIVRLPTDKSHTAGDPVTVADTGHYGI